MIMRLIFSIFTILLLLSFNSCKKEVSTSPPEPKPENSGKLYVDSNPRGALIFLNNKNTGYKTPDTVPYLNEGSYDLKLKLDFYKDSSEVVTLQKDKTTSLFFDYISNPTMRGYIYIDSNPRAAKISINDSLTDKVTPVTISNFLPGQYNIKLEKDGYWSSENIVPVRSERTSRININLKDTLTWVCYNTSHSIDIASDYLTCVAADGNTIWAGSFEGLIRYENNIWTVFNTGNSSLPSNKVNKIIVDDQHNKWVCTDNGLVKVNGSSWIIYNSGNSGLPDNDIAAVAFENSTNMWIALRYAGAVRFDGSQWQIYNSSNSPLPTNNLNTVSVGPDGTIWFGTKGGGITKFVADTLWKTYDAYNSAPRANGGEPGGTSWLGFPNNNIQCIAYDVNNTIWIGIGIGTGPLAGNDGGSAYFKGPVYWKTYFRIPSVNVMSLIRDHHNVLWFGNAEGGLTKYDGATWITFNSSNSNLESNRIYDIAEDDTGNLWLASYGSGLVKYKGNQ